MENFDRQEREGSNFSARVGFHNSNIKVILKIILIQI